MVSTKLAVPLAGSAGEQTTTNPPCNVGPYMELSISVSKCGQVPGRHREMGVSLDHRAGQSAHTTHSCSIYHGPLV
ncbi:hypothetical protein EYF80_041262 [Liparis tanakae]|uniref:Uncharacterized protein n=1 Tax=Liparis tanakae TaxID=230148 RepID=A0A4Z2G4Q2_9TELE|nr:hypothetical protein EYF80_041262 [Liparis tanakae]